MATVSTVMGIKISESAESEVESTESGGVEETGLCGVFRSKNSGRGEADERGHSCCESELGEDLVGLSALNFCVRL